MNRKRIVYLIFAMAIGMLLIALWLQHIDLDEVLLRIRGVAWPPVLMAATCYLMAYLLRSLRWNVLLAKHRAIPCRKTWQYSMAGNFVNYLIPIRMGEVVKAWFIKHNHQSSIVAALPSIFIDKSFDTVGIFFVLIMLPFIGVRISGAMLVLIALLLVVFLVSLLLIMAAAWKKQRVLGILSRMASILPKKLSKKLGVYVEMFIHGLNIFEHHWSRLLLAIALTGLGIMADGLYFWLVFQAFRISIPYITVLFGYTLINLSYALPQPPAQLGSNEWMMLIIFSIGFKLTSTDASAIMAFAHVLTFTLMSMIGIPALALGGKQVLKQMIKGDEIDDQ